MKKSVQMFFLWMFVMSLLLLCVFSVSSVNADSATFEISGHAEGQDGDNDNTGKVGVDFFFDQSGLDYEVVNIETQKCWDKTKVRDKLVEAIKNAEIDQIASVIAVGDSGIKVTFKGDSEFYCASGATSDAGISISTEISFAYADFRTPDVATVVANFNDPESLGTTAGFNVSFGDEYDVVGLEVVDTNTYRDSAGSLAVTVNLSSDEDPAEIMLPLHLPTAGQDLLAFSIMLPDNLPTDTNVSVSIFNENGTLFPLGNFIADIPGFYTNQVVLLPLDLMQSPFIENISFGIESSTGFSNGTIYLDEISLIDIGPTTPEELGEEIRKLREEDKDFKEKIEQNLIIGMSFLVFIITGTILGGYARNRKKDEKKEKDFWGEGDYLDGWSIIHLLTGLLIGMLINLLDVSSSTFLKILPLILLLLILWEIIEYLFLDVEETIPNIILDVILGLIGALIGFYMDVVISRYVKTILFVLLLILYIILHIWALWDHFKKKKMR